MTKVFVSGCYDILHGGHIQFFKDARALGDHLTVCFASDEVYRAWKGREPALPEDSRRAILKELRCVDTVVMSELRPPTWTDLAVHPAFDFAQRFIECRPNILAITEDDKYMHEKAGFAEYFGAVCIWHPKLSSCTPISTTQIRERAGL